MKKNYKRECFKNRDEWLKARGIGGSSASAIIGVSPYTTPIDLLATIIDPQGEKSDKENLEAKRFGIINEPLIRQTFASCFPDFKVIAPRGNAIYRRIDKPYMTATLDGEVIRNSDNAKGFVEIKTRDIRRHEDIDEWLDRSTGKPTIIPQRYFSQIIHYFNVCNDMQFCFVVAQLKFFDFNKPKSLNVHHLETYFYYIERSEVEDSIKNLDTLETKFWEHNVKGKHLPPIIINL